LLQPIQHSSQDRVRRRTVAGRQYSTGRRPYGQSLGRAEKGSSEFQLAVLPRRRVAVLGGKAGQTVVISLVSPFQQQERIASGQARVPQRLRQGGSSGFENFP